MTPREKMFRYDLIPERFHESLDAYRDHGRPTGGFLLSVLEGDLFQAVTRADEEALEYLPTIVAYIANKMPSGCFGDRDRVDEWITDGGLRGMESGRRAQGRIW